MEQKQTNSVIEHVLALLALLRQNNDAVDQLPVMELAYSALVDERLDIPRHALDQLLHVSLLLVQEAAEVCIVGHTFGYQVA